MEPQVSPLEVPVFYSLYRGALELDDEQRRIRAVGVLLLGGRLGLRTDEILHVHEGWIDWNRGEIRVPAREPCACAHCWDAVEDYDDDRSTRQRVYQEQWAPPSGRGPRTIPFGWSQRISAALLAFFDTDGATGLSQRELERLLDSAAKHATGIDADRLDLDSLSLTGLDFFARLGADTPTLRQLVGTRRDGADDLAVSLDRTAAETIHELSRAESELAERGQTPDRFPVACNPTAFEGEPFDPTTVTHATRRKRAARQNKQPHQVRNPRAIEPPEGLEYDATNHYPPQPYDPMSKYVEAEDGAAQASALEMWMRQQEALRGGTDPLEADRTPDTEGETKSIEPDDGPEKPPEHKRPIDAGDTQVRSQLTEPIVADFTARFLVPGIAGKTPIEGRILLGQDELLVISDPSATDLGNPRTEWRLIFLDDVVDMTLDYNPDGYESEFDTTVAVAFRPNADRRVLVIELPSSKRWDFSTALFRMLMNVTPVRTTHPARIGGRVTNEEPRRVLMYIRPRQVEFTDEEGERTLYTIRLSDIIHVDRNKQLHDGAERQVVAVRHIQDNRPVTSYIGPEESRLLPLFERFAKREYRDHLREVQDIDLSMAEKQILVALYTTDKSVGIGDVMNKDPKKLSGILATLEDKELVRQTDGGATLTGIGQLAVSDRMEAVND